MSQENYPETCDGMIDAVLDDTSIIDGVVVRMAESGLFDFAEHQASMPPIPPTGWDFA